MRKIKISFPKTEKGLVDTVGDGAQSVRTTAADGVRGVAAYVEHPTEVISDARSGAGKFLGWLSDAIEPAKEEEEAPAPKRKPRKKRGEVTRIKSS